MRYVSMGWAAVLGVLLGVAGYHVTDWQFWAAFGVSTVAYLIGRYEESK